MAFEFQLAVMPTGSFAVRISARGETMPAEIKMTVSGGSTLLETDALKVYPGPYNHVHDVELIGPFPFDVTYIVDVIFDDMTEHQFTGVTNPLPDKRRAAVLRQRIYELLLAAYESGDIDAMPLGSPHAPGSINAKMKISTGTVLEVGVGYIDRAVMNSYREQENEVVIPLTGFASCDEVEDAGVLMADMEEVIAYLMSTDWKLNGFQMNQTQAEFDTGKPAFNDDRKMVTCAGSLRVPMRRFVR